MPCNDIGGRPGGERIIVERALTQQRFLRQTRDQRNGGLPDGGVILKGFPQRKLAEGRILHKNLAFVTREFAGIPARDVENAVAP
ncbi:Uncharacterised protein [Actinobacillus pleuropneumoniae]|nr:Uncharacterised protein [Actinobacillus pleuropneumoniae]